MASQLELIQEAVKRGLPIPPEKKELYDEAIKRGLIKPDGSQPGTFDDVIQSRDSGLAMGLTGLVTGPMWLGDKVGEGINRGIGWATGRDPAETEKIVQAGRGASDYVRGLVEAPAKAVGADPNYQPKTTPGRLMKKGIAIGGGAMFGPGSWGQMAGQVGGAIAGSELGRAVIDPMLEGSWAEGFGENLIGPIGGGITGNAIANRAMTTPVPGQTRASENMLRPALEKNQTPMHPDELLLNRTNRTVGLAKGLAAGADDASDRIITALDDQATGVRGRVEGEMNSAIGPYYEPERLKNVVMKRGQSLANPKYKAAISNAPQMPLPSNLSQKIIGLGDDMALGQRETLKGIAQQVDDAVSGAQSPEQVARRLMALRASLDKSIVYDKMAFNSLSTADKTAQVALRKARGVIDDVLKKEIGTGAGDEIMAGAHRKSESVDFGYDVLEGGKTALPPNRLEPTVTQQKLDPNMVQHGARARLGTAAGTGRELNDAKMAVNTPWNREKLNTMFGKNNVDKVATMLDREMGWKQNSADISRNSQTAQRQAAGKMVDAPDAPMFTGQETIFGTAGKLVGKAGSAITKKMLDMKSQPTRDALVTALIQKGPAGQELAQKILANIPINSSPLNRALLISSILMSNDRDKP